MRRRRPPPALAEKELNVYQIWRKRWNLWHGKKARLAFKLQDWESFLLFIRDRNIHTFLEFGCGLSTIMLSRVFDSVTSYETDAEFIKDVQKHCTPNTVIHHWDNTPETFKGGSFDLAFVDGIMPRDPQAKLASESAKFVAVHDIRGCGRRAIRLLEKWKPIASVSPQLGFFENVA